MFIEVIQGVGVDIFMLNNQENLLFSINYQRILVLKILILDRGIFFYSILSTGVFILIICFNANPAILAYL